MVFILPQLTGHFLDFILTRRLSHPHIIHLPCHLLHQLLLSLYLCVHPVLGRLLKLQLALQLPDLELQPLVLHRAHVLPLQVVQPLAQLSVLLPQLVPLTLQGLDGQRLVLDSWVYISQEAHTRVGWKVKDLTEES